MHILCIIWLEWLVCEISGSICVCEVLALDYVDWETVGVYMTKCQKVRKSWVKILTVNKIWSNYVVLMLRLESVQKWPKKQWTQYKHLCWSAYGDICIRRRFKLWNRAHENGQRNSDWLLRRLRTCAQYTNKFNFTKDYERSIPLHNSVNINRQIFNLCSWSFLKDRDDRRRA